MDEVRVFRDAAVVEPEELDLVFGDCFTKLSEIAPFRLFIEIVSAPYFIFNVEWLRDCSVGEDRRSRTGEDEAEVDAEGGDG